MKARRGQIAIYLVAIVLAIAVLAVMNVSVFLSVRSKNRAMNAGDAAALAVAKHQGELLNKIGADNILHLKAAIAGDEQTCREIMERQKRMCFLGPLEGIRLGNAAARANGVDRDAGGGMAKILRDHVLDIRTVFMQNVDSYPEPWEGAWGEYADSLEAIVGTLGDEMVVGPENVEFVDAWQCFPLVTKMFYEAIAGRNWCWFHFNGTWLFDCDSHNMPRPDFAEPTPNYNSEVYSLHLTFAPLTRLADPEMMQLVMDLAGCTKEELAVASKLLSDPEQVWAFFDDMWHPWHEIDPLNGFPAAGTVKPEYDVRGCAAICRVENGFADLVEGREGVASWTAAAKPFGTVEDLDGNLAPVTALKRLVTPAFTEVRLVPLDAVGGADLSTADCVWMDHVRDHLPKYLQNGPLAVGINCFYCDQLRLWEGATFRAMGRSWLKFNSGTCRRPLGPGGGTGGTAHGH